MPRILEDCVKKLIKKGKSRSSAFAICTASLEKAGKLHMKKKKKGRKKG